MEFLVGGLALAANGILFFMSSYAFEHGTLPTWDEANKPENQSLYRQALLVSLFGLFIALIGVVGFAGGVFSRGMGAKESLLCATVLFYLNCQARLVLYGVRHKPGLNKGENLHSTLKKALSVGLFPTGSGFLSGLVAASQIAAVLLPLYWLVFVR